MRFEVKAGGVVAIFFGLAALSGGVFIFGMKAGYDIAQQSANDAEKVATDYPLTAPAPSSTPLAPGAPVAPAPASGATKGLVEGTVGGFPVPHAKPRAAPVALAPPVTRPAVASIPAAPIKPVAPPPVLNAAVAPGAAATFAETAPPEEEPAEEPTPRVRNSARKPFNIEIQAAMDSTSASQMAARLQSLGYQPRLSPTRINGATWYKVEVGPYMTQAEAAAAEVTLRQKYNATFGRGADPAQPTEDEQAPSD